MDRCKKAIQGDFLYKHNMYKLEGKTLVYGTSVYSERKGRSKKRRVKIREEDKRDVNTSTDTALSTVSFQYIPFYSPC